MKLRKILIILLTLLFMSLLLIFPAEATKGAVKGLVMCSDIVIPSLFPFGVCALFLYNIGMFKAVENSISNITKLLFRINGRNFCIFLMSFLGGYPIGAILIEKLYKDKQISKRNAENMLNFCVNSGPAFIIIGIGSGIFGNADIGLLLFASNVLASILSAFVMKKFSVYEECASKVKAEKQKLTDAFVESTASAAKSIISVCSFVILFSTIIGIIMALPINADIIKICALILEITNATVISGKNIYLLSFLLGFGGLCIHFQILSVLKTLKPSYLKFLIGRVFHGALSVLLTFILLKIFPVSVETLSSSAFIGELSSISLPFSAALIFLCTTFLISLKNKSGKFF